MRVLALLLMMLTSGVPHLLVDVCAGAGGCVDDRVADDCGGDCDRGERDCSPVCHDCICSVGAPALTRAALAVVVMPTPPVQVEVRQPRAVDTQRGAPRAPSLAGVFHPPKA